MPSDDRQWGELSLFGYEARIHASVDIELRNGQDIIYVSDVKVARRGGADGSTLELHPSLVKVAAAIDSYQERTAR